MKTNVFNPEKFYNPNHAENKLDVFDTITNFLDLSNPEDSVSLLHKLWQGYLRSQLDKGDIELDYDEYLTICQLIVRIQNLEKDPHFNPWSKQCICRIRSERISKCPESSTDKDDPEELNWIKEVDEMLKALNLILCRKDNPSMDMHTIKGLYDNLNKHKARLIDISEIFYEKDNL